jgi:hypothetical protein
MPLDRRSLLAISRAKRKLAAAHAADMAALEKYFRDEVASLREEMARDRAALRQIVRTFALGHDETTSLH